MSIEPAGGWAARLLPPWLRGGWLFAGRAAWVVLALVSLALFLAGLPPAFAAFRAGCATAPCPVSGQLSPDGMRALHDLPISPTAYAAVQVAGRALAGCVCMATAALIFRHRAAGRIGLLAAVALVAYGGSINGQALRMAHSAWSVPLQAHANLGFTSMFILFYLFSDGCFVPRWTRALVPVWVATQVSILFPRASPLNLNNHPWLNLPLIVVCFGSAALAQVYRYRRASRPVERQQTKWVAASAATATLAYLAGGIAPLAFPGLARPGLPEVGYQVSSFITFGLLPLLVPLSIVVAIFRYRLWDIDALINRALVYGALTATLALVYFGGVALLQEGVGLITGRQSSPLAIVASTLAIATLFQPLRRRIQSAIDRRFYRRKYDAARVVAAFGMRLRDETDLDTLRANLLSTVDAALQPAHVSLWLGPSRGSRRLGEGDSR